MRLPQKYTPHEYQQRGIKLLVSPTGGGLFLKPGLGKTSMMLAAFKLFKRQNLYRKMLVVAPLRVAQLVWPEEVASWVDFDDLSCVVLHGPCKEQRLKQDADVYCVNFEGLDWIIPLIQAGKTPRFDILVVDESSRMRNTDGKRYKLLKKVLSKFSRRYILTGTPQPKALYNLFGQIYIADLGASLGKYITHFRSEFFYKKEGDEYNYYPFPGADEKVYARIKHRIFHLSDEDYLNLPQLDQVNIMVTLPDNARRQYKTMEREFLLALDEGLVVAANAAVASGKCRQICNGFVYKPDSSEYELLHAAKLDAFKELLGELQGENVIVVYQYEADYQRMSEVAPGVKFTGAKNPEEIKTAWDNGDISVLYVHPQSAGYGLNLQRGGCTMIWFGLTFNYEDIAQTIKRIHRQGQTRPVTIYFILAKSTIEDKVILPVIKEREMNQEKLFATLREYWEAIKHEDVYE